MYTRMERYSGSLIVSRRFTVQRAGHAAHTVEVEVSESGAPQRETCDCAGFRYRHDCAHIRAVMDQAEFEVCYD